jgi:hypothetical protein
MAARKLAEYVHVDGNVYEPGTAEKDLPNGVAEQITNPAAWGEGTADDAGTPAAADGPPPRAGAGSGTDAWKAYAASFDPPVEVADDAKRDDIIAAIESAGHPVE